MKVNMSYMTLLMFFWLPCVSAQDDQYDSLFDLTLKELLNIEVSVASTTAETVIETPAIVSRYDRIDLENMGVTTLREMFNFIPGVIVQDSLPGFASVQIRGIDETFNQKVLFLLDGVPYYQASHSMIPMEGIPWESISHVEVIRGPGTVFYGSQASGGVFNVITRKDSGENSAIFKIGRNDLREGSAYYNKALSDDSTIVIAAENRTEEGYRATYNEVFTSEGLVTDGVDRYLEKKSGLLRYAYKDFILQLQAFTSTTVGINDAVTDENTLQPFIIDSKSEFIHIENNWRTANSQTTLFSDYNQYTFDIRINNLFAPGKDALAAKDNDGRDDYRFRFGGSFSYAMNELLDLVVGAEQETRSTGYYRFYLNDMPSDPLATLLEKGKVDEFSAYTQLDYQYDGWRFLIGGRFTDNERSGEKITPRLAAVYKIDAQQSIKALYSTGFNSPNPTQTSLNPTDESATIVGNESLTAEVVKTTDIAYSYAEDNVLFVFNAYYLEAEDFIIREFSDSTGTVSFFNEGNFNRKGAEVDFQMANRDSKVFANLAYQKDGNQVNVDDPAAFNTPRLTLTLGANTNIGDSHNIGGNVSYIGARHNLDAYSIVNANYTARFTNFDLFAVVRNIFDEDILNPDNTTQNSNLVAQGEDGINAQAGIRLHF
jgi:outer membrane receptor protein involved in Fe transport